MTEVYHARFRCHRSADNLDSTRFVALVARAGARRSAIRRVERRVEKLRSRALESSGVELVFELATRQRLGQLIEVGNQLAQVFGVLFAGGSAQDVEPWGDPEKV